MLHRPLAVLALAVAMTAVGSARAVETLPERSAEQRCLTPPQDRPPPLLYPAGALARLSAGTVQVELTFSAPDAGPEVKVLPGDPIDEELVDAVRSHVTQYRVPCLSREAAPVRFQQAFVFTPNEGRKVVWTQARDTRPGPELACQTHVRPGSSAQWPMRPRAAFGKVMLRMEFSRADQPPKVEVISGDPSDPFAVEAVDWAQGIRVPCMTKPFVATQMYHFILEGARPVALADMPLTTFLRSARGVTDVPVYFDMRTMGCPFELRVRYLRPHELNQVGEIGRSVPARRPFLDWISRLALDLKPQQQALVLGDEFTLTVPCGTLDL